MPSNELIVSPLEYLFVYTWTFKKEKENLSKIWLSGWRLKCGISHFSCSVGCIQARAPSGSSLSDVIGPRFWFKSPPGGKPNIRLLLLGPDVGYSFRPHSSSSVGHGDAELKQPGTASSERSFRLFSNTWKEIRFYQISDGTLCRRSTHNHCYSVGHTPSAVCHLNRHL